MPNPQQWEKIKEIVGAALERDAAERTAFLDQACSNDSSLRAEVDSLLSAYRDADPLSQGVQTTELADGLPALHSVGPYQLIQLLGEGGMGQVWLAEQTSPVRRKVALKLIKTGIFDESVLRRFQTERQSLAIMDHPAIAKVFDAGATPDGQPYFVMEYVPGLPLTEYCDEKRLKIRGRLELFVHTCEGVQHAHQKALIHRDLKPANILVVEVDGHPQPRIIDFGLAKSVTPFFGGDFGQTRVGAFVGTPGYMSPEQADPGSVDVDTRTDVYSLGVILYELLTGSLPFDTSQWKNLRLEELLRRLREEEPARPSTKITRDRKSSSQLAQARGTEPQQLASLLRGDLDWITLKALDKDRNRRYATPNDLAADLRRYLCSEPVSARPASTAYRLQKYIRRNRVAVGFTSGLVLLLAGFAVLQTIQLRRTTRERDRASRVTGFMTDMFKVSDPSESRGNSITAREILDRASNQINTGLASDPELQARLMHTMGNVYSSLGLYSRAHSILQQALEIQRRSLGPRHIDTLESASSLGDALRLEGHLVDAETLERETLDAQRRSLGPRHPDTLRSATLLAQALEAEGRFPEAEKLLRESLDLQRQTLGNEHPEILFSMRVLSGIMRQQARYAEAEKLQREILDIQLRSLGPDHPSTVGTMNSLANTLLQQARFPEAEQLYRQVLAVDQRIYGPQHPETLVVMGNLANTISQEGHYSEAAGIQRQILEIETRISGPEHPDTLLAMHDLAVTLGNDNRFAEAENLQRQMIAIGRRTLGPEHALVLEATNALAGNLQREGRFAEAEKLERETLEVERRALGPEKPETLESMNNLGATLEGEGRYADAEKIQRETLVIVSRVFGPQHPNSLSVMTNLAETLSHEGRFSEAEKLQRDVLDQVRRTFGPVSPQALDSVQALALYLSREKHFDEARPLFSEAVQIATQINVEDGLSAAWYSSGCGAALAGRHDDALADLRRSIDAGYSDASQMAGDADLKSLHNDPRFTALIASLRRPATAQQKSQ